jgi:topoisomerase-4 subunit A
VVFNPKTTEWQFSYDGRNEEPVNLPVKFPLLLAQGVEGIAVGLSSKILPHNFNEICDAAVSYLHGEDFKLYPDFQTGGAIEVSKYNDGERGGSVRVRAKIEKVDNHTLAIRELPFGRTVANVCDSIVKANDKGKIKVKQVEDLTSANVEILVHLQSGVSSDKTIDALYAFTDCEINISQSQACCRKHRGHRSRNRICVYGDNRDRNGDGCCNETHRPKDHAVNEQSRPRKNKRNCSRL